MKKCPFCEAEIEESARFCLYCMQSLTKKEQILPHQRKKTQWIAITAAIVALLLLLAIILLGKQLALGNGVPSDDQHLDPTTSTTRAEPSDDPSVTEPIHTHSYSVENTEIEYLKEEATCQSPAIYYYSCSCGEIGNETFSYGEVGEHVTVTDPELPAACDTSGLTEGAHCSVCQVVLVPQHIIPALTHTFDDDRDDTCNVCNYVRVLDCDHSETVKLPYLAPTCTTTGLTEGRKCALCEEILTAQVLIDPLGHTEVIDPAVPATCTKTGLTEGKHCSVCEEILTVQFSTAPKGHTFDPNDVLSPCSVCGYSPTHTHNWTEANTDTKYLKEEANCESPAVYYYSCACGDIGSETFEDGDYGDHVVVIDSERQLPTCTTVGFTEASHCSVCNMVLRERWPYTESLGHNFVPGDSLPICSRCGGTGKAIVKAPALPYVVGGKYQINSLSYNILVKSQSGQTELTLSINYTNLSSETITEGPSAKLSYTYYSRVEYADIINRYSWPKLDPGESGTVIIQFEYLDEDIGNIFNIELAL